MLRRGEEDFASSSCDYLDHPPGDAAQPSSAGIYVFFAPAKWNMETHLALVDTGGAWSILNREVAAGLDLFAESGEALRMSTRLGPFDGRLVRVDLAVLADQGTSVVIPATVWVSEDWPGPNIFGYSGLLERLRFAVDPQINRLYFSAC